MRWTYLSAGALGAYLALVLELPVFDPVGLGLLVLFAAHGEAVRSDVRRVSR